MIQIHCVCGEAATFAGTHGSSAVGCDYCRKFSRQVSTAAVRRVAALLPHALLSTIEWAPSLCGSVSLQSVRPLLFYADAVNRKLSPTVAEGKQVRGSRFESSHWDCPPPRHAESDRLVTRRGRIYAWEGLSGDTCSVSISLGLRSGGKQLGFSHYPRGAQCVQFQGGSVSGGRCGISS